MTIEENSPLRQLTSLGAGGEAKTLITITSSSEIHEALKISANKKLWLLGHGTNTLVSDYGLPGITLRFASGKITQLDKNTLVADAGTSWDDLVKKAISLDLWGIELMSGIPGSVGAATFINISAYGQSLSDTITWVEVVDYKNREIKKLDASDLEWDYKRSLFQDRDDLIILRAAFSLSTNMTTRLTYKKALEEAKRYGLDPNSLIDRREIILHARKRAGSMFRNNGKHAKTAGSFFKNPLVSKEKISTILAHEEFGLTKEQILEMNKAHGGNAFRVSAAHVLLAAGFKRGQSWGSVRLHPDHVLKIENTGNATAQQIYDVAKEIITTVKEKLDINLEPEVRFLGKFD